MEKFSSTESIAPACAERRLERIIGTSPALKAALAEVERVAPTNATVLVLGETGTGKELIAHAIHDLSPRCDRPFVKLDCAAIPFDLLESELFGHEIGAFPWAVAQRIGRFEMADGGTLFLDEIGDLPLALQPKLLRILQEQEFERPGSSRTLRVNVRLVAATHRDLLGMIRRGEFRSDLYYRLSGFPLLLSPLRERRQDISLLVSHFVELFASRIGKRIHHIPEETLHAFAAHSWPGNVRELQNLIERAVILSNDGVLPNLLAASNRNSVTATHQRSGVDDSHKAAIHPNCRVSSDLLPTSEEHSVCAAPVPGHGLRSSDAPADLPTVFIVDGDVAVRESVELLIRHVGWQPVAFAFAHEFLDRPRPLLPNCLVIDVSLQDLNGLDLQKRFAVERSETPIIFIAGEGDVPTSVRAMKAGAVEFLIKPFSDEALLDAIREALKRSSVALGREAEMRSIRDRYASLSHRERQVMALVLSGLLNKQVGAELGISEITVKAHRGRVMQKMGAKSVIDLVKMTARLRSDRAFFGSGPFRSPSASPAMASPLAAR
ncbi:MAG TPA: sigma 54-interacting transcriptional regulator [Acidobacteriaceae bacterium]|nr:sigma 54-interacting transcriptional regulator [Acidobacteriaceae bacterium]